MNHRNPCVGKVRLIVSNTSLGKYLLNDMVHPPKRGVPKRRPRADKQQFFPNLKNIKPLCMKTILLTNALVALQLSVSAQGPKESSRYSLKGNFLISLSGGGSEYFGSDEKGERYFLTNPKVGYHLSDKFMVLAETI